MCGIVGYIGEEQAAPILLNGLQKLEYRGYDSAGVAVYNDTGLHVVKSKGAAERFGGHPGGGAETCPAPWASATPGGPLTALPATSTPILRSAMGANLWWCITASSRITWS